MRFWRKRRCRYADCQSDYKIASDTEQVTCELCREYLGLPELAA